MTLSPIPEEFQAITPHLTVRDAANAIRFYGSAFGARELFRNAAANGLIMHAELLLGSSRFFVNDEFPEYGTLGPPEPSVGRAPVVLHLYVPDVDAALARAVTAGATVLIPAANMPWGDRYAELRDPFGHCWSLASRHEDLSPRELQRRMSQRRAGTH
jgi:PhnB protein